MLNRCAKSQVCPPWAANPIRENPLPADEALVFAQGSNTRAQCLPSTVATTSKSLASFLSIGSKPRGSKSYTSVQCKNCGKLGHISSVCLDLKPLPVQIHAMTGHDDASKSTDDKSIPILTQYDMATSHGDTVFAQDSSPGNPIISDLVLLDSQSTVDLFSYPELVNNICPSQNPINIHCNKGTLTTSMEANFGDTPVYFDERSIADVLSLYQLGQKFHITYDSHDCGSVFMLD